MAAGADAPVPPAARVKSIFRMNLSTNFVRRASSSGVLVRRPRPAPVRARDACEGVSQRSLSRVVSCYWCGTRRMYWLIAPAGIAASGAHRLRAILDRCLLLSETKTRAARAVGLSVSCLGGSLVLLQREAPEDSKEALLCVYRAGTHVRRRLCAAVLS